jgi:hypothetical protein
MIVKILVCTLFVFACITIRALFLAVRHAKRESKAWEFAHRTQKTYVEILKRTAEYGRTINRQGHRIHRLKLKAESLSKQEKKS